MDKTKHDDICAARYSGKSPEWYAFWGGKCPGCGAEARHELKK